MIIAAVKADDDPALVANWLCSLSTVSSVEFQILLLAEDATTPELVLDGVDEKAHVTVREEENTDSAICSIVLDLFRFNVSVVLADVHQVRFFEDHNGGLCKG